MFRGFGSEVLGSPVLIITPGLGASHPGDQSLQFFPIVSFLQDGVHPTVNDAVTGIVLFLVVSVMFFVAEDQAGALQEADDGVGLAVDHVCPFVNFVGQDPEHNSEDDRPFVSLAENSIRAEPQPECYEEWHWVAGAGIGFHKAVFGNILRVDMMHPETSDQGGANDRSIKTSPGIASPVQHSRDPIDQKLCGNEASNHAHWGLVIVGESVLDEFSPQTESEDEEQKLPDELAGWIGVLPKNLAVGLYFLKSRHGHDNRLIVLQIKIKFTCDQKIVQIGSNCYPMQANRFRNIWSQQRKIPIRRLS